MTRGNYLSVASFFAIVLLPLLDRRQITSIPIATTEKGRGIRNIGGWRWVSFLVATIERRKLVGLEWLVIGLVTVYWVPICSREGIMSIIKNFRIHQT